MSEFVNIAAYKFVALDRLAERKTKLMPRCQALELKGTILLANEGINLFLAGSRSNIEQFLSELRSEPEFVDLPIKESLSDYQPFSRMLIRLKKEIISMGIQEIVPQQKTSPKISANELKQWLDEGRDIALLDVRNDYEINVGTFEKAIPIGVDHFRKFPEATARLSSQLKKKPVVMFCTGGIRCEKAGPLMEQHGFEQVFQLDGGILKYFEECGGEHYRGDCFVFDKRVAVDPALQETEAEQCFGCQAVLTAEDQRSEYYNPPDVCPHCYQTEQQQMAAMLECRSAALQAAVHPLPGRQPYLNRRPMSVSQKFDGCQAADFLVSVNSRLDREFWIRECGESRVVYQDSPLAADTIVRAGQRLEHLVPHTVEPDVSTDIKFLYEDDRLIAICKPAPLPMHPCGRFNRNTLQHFMRLAYPRERIRILHRLDAETTGVVLFARTKTAAASIQSQFAGGTIQKTYVARAIGHPDWDQYHCDAPISDGAVGPLGIRRVEPEGLAAATDFEVLDRDADGTTLVRCRPQTGRTNQIRIHLAHLGYPILGDAMYGGNPGGGEVGCHDEGYQGKHLPLQLHASQIVYCNLSGQSNAVNAPLPDWATP